MRRVISTILTLAIFASFFSGFAVSASAATSEWSVYSEYCYYDSKNKTEYHVVFSFKENYKTRVFVKDYYISQMKVETYKTVRSGNSNKATVTKQTGILKQNSKTTIDTCLDYLEAYYPSLYTTYKKASQDQENYRIVYIHKISGSTSSTMGEWSKHTIQKYIEEYKKYALKKLPGDINDYIEKIIESMLPTSLQVLGSASSVNDDYEALKELCVDVIGTMNNSIELIWLDSYYDSACLANGAPSVKKLFDAANAYKTSKTWYTKSLDSQKHVKLATDIYTLPLN